MRLAGLPDAWLSTGSRSPGSGRSSAPRSPRRGGRRRRCRCRRGGGRDADAARPGLLAGGPSPGGMVLGSVPGRDAVPCRGRSRAEDRRDDRRRRGAAHTRRPRTYSSGAGRLRGERVGGSGARRLPPRDPVNRRDLPRAGRARLGRPSAAGGDARGFGSGPLRPLSVSGRPGRGGDPRTPSGRLAARPQRCGVARGLPDAQVRRAGRDQTQRGRRPLSGALGGPGPLCLLTNARKPWATQAPWTLISAR